ncbi:MAG TPA: hypothetical protein ENN05_01590 [Deltaproteobacteria bacterium]|nr:hypothetical protein [Deltaproteobacteria bacterium]
MKTEQNEIVERTQNKPFDPIGSLAMHWLEIALFGTVLFVFTLPLIILLNKPIYSVNGKILVSPAVQTFIIGNEETPITGYYNAYVRTHVNRLQEQDIMEKALEKLDPDLQSIFIPDDSPLSLAAAILLKRVEIFHLAGSHLVGIRIEGENPYGLAEIVNSIMEVYMEKIQNEMEGKDSRRLMYLQDEKEKLEKEILAQTRVSQELAKEVGTFSFDSNDNAYNAQFESLQQEYSKAYSNRVHKENILRAYIKQAELIRQIPIDSLVEEYLAQNSSVENITRITNQQLQELQVLLSTYGDQNPNKSIIETKIQTYDEMLENLKENERIKARYIVSEKRNYELEEGLIAARSEFEAAKNAEEEILKQRNLDLANRGNISQKILNGQQIKEKIEHLRMLLNKIDARLSELQLEAKAPGRLQIENIAKRPQSPTGSKIKKLLIVFFLVSYGFITLICVFYDFFDKRIRDRKDVLHGLGSHPTWPISDYRFTGMGIVPFSRVTIDDSSNVAAKAIQSLSIRIDKERKEHNSQCAVFTGIDRRCGTTEILLNTAYAFTKLCSKILVIDAQLDHPCIGSITQTCTTKSGLIDFLHNKTDIKDCIVHDYERCIDYILPGHTPSSGELASLDLSTFQQMISDLKKEYSFIFIDAPPILLSDMTEYLALQSDMVITVIQGDKSLYQDLYMAGNILFRLKVKAIAAVLNWGAPRNLNKAQIVVSRILWPIEKILAKVLGKDPKYVKYFIP